MRNASQPVLRELTISVDSLPRSFDGYRLLHLSDLHLDSVPRLADITADLLARTHADLVLITGDYRFGTSGPCNEVFEGMRTILGAISPPDGVFGILGNHDSSEMAYPLEELGVQLLINDAVPIARGFEQIWIAGVDDSFDYRTHDLSRAFREVPRDACSVLMSHCPDLYTEAAEAGVNLYLCGHTHAGQVRLPVIGSLIQNSDAPRDYTHGQWQHGNMHGYTSAGLGCSMLPIRFNCPPEIVAINLRCRS